MRHCHCDDYARSEREHLPGMPTPAGHGLTRRAFVARAAGMALAVYGGRALAPAAYEEGIAAAAAAAPSDAVLVSIFMSGGADSLSLLAPVNDASYQSWRPSLRVQSTALPFAGDDRLFWHPTLAPLASLHGAGKLSVVPSIGYADPNQSHFTSRHYWEVGRLDPFGRVGWLGRYLDLHGSDTNPLQGLSLDYSLAPSLAPQDKPVAAVPDPQRYSFWARDVWDASLRTGMVDAFGDLGDLPTSDGELRAARAATRMTRGLGEQLAPLQGNGTIAPTVTYPAGTFPRRLSALAEMVGRGMPLKVVALDANGGYDTHASQEGSLPEDLDLFARSLAAFQQDLENRGIADRVLVHVWSEFGRRPRENGSGTDHGAAGTSFVMGTQASGQLIGEWRGLDDLDAHQNLRHSVDFRDVYRALLDQWLGVDPDPIVAGSSTLPQLVR